MSTFTKQVLVIVLCGILFQRISVIQSVQTLIPLSPTSDAFQRGNKASNVVVEFFIDLTCSSCLDEWYKYFYNHTIIILLHNHRPVLSEVVSTYGIKHL